MTLPAVIAAIRAEADRLTSDPAMALTVLLCATAEACREAGVDFEEGMERAEAAMMCSSGMEGAVA